MPTALDSYDGAARLFWPDDVHLIGSRAALVSLRDALNRALGSGHAVSDLGPIVDGEMRAFVVTLLEPLSAARNPQLPEPAPVRARHGIPPRVERSQPVLAGVDREYR